LEKDAPSSSTIYLFGSVIRHWRPRDLAGARSGILGFSSWRSRQLRLYRVFSSLGCVYGFWGSLPADGRLEPRGFLNFLSAPEILSWKLEVELNSILFLLVPNRSQVPLTDSWKLS
jgi:hypothetical protein